jgi:hypothetical protein
MLGRNLHDSQNVYIKGERIRGVQSCSGGWTAPETYVNALGYDGGFIGNVVEESLQANFDVERLMISPHDPITSLLADEQMSGEVAYGDGKNFAFNGGFITSYSCACAIGEIPSLNFSLLAYGQSGGSVPAEARTPELDDSIIIAHPGSILLDVDGFETNRIQSFEVSVNIERTPYNIIGQLQPSEFIMQFPIQVDCTFSMHVDDYESSNMHDFVCTPKEQNLNFAFKDCASGDEIRRLFVKQAYLMDYNQSGGIGEPLEANFTYKSNLNSIENLRKTLEGISF